jgi:hypothetical protein
MAFVFKYWAAAILATPAFLMLFGKDLRAYPGQTVLIAPLLLASVFSLTAAEVQVKDERLRYRRFIEWKEVPYPEILACRKCIWPVYGVLKTMPPIPPWRRLYFVIAMPYRSTYPNPLITSINNRLKATNERADGK